MFTFLWANMFKVLKFVLTKGKKVNFILKKG